MLEFSLESMVTHINTQSNHLVFHKPNQITSTPYLKCARTDGVSIKTEKAKKKCTHKMDAIKKENFIDRKRKRKKAKKKRRNMTEQKART